MEKNFIILTILFSCSISPIFAVRSHHRVHMCSEETQTTELQADEAYHMGLIYYDHQAWDKALELFRQAADLDHTKAQYMVAKLLYNEGKCSFEDLKEAFEYCKLAKLKEYPRAINLYQYIQADLTEKMLEKCSEPIKIDLNEILSKVGEKGDAAEEAGEDEEEGNGSSSEQEHKEKNSVPEGMYI